MSQSFQHETYLAKASAIHVSAEVAEAELAAVMSEVHDPSSLLFVEPGEEYAIAWRRLISGGPQSRPGDAARSALRSAYPAAHPDWIDQAARQTAPGATLASEWQPT